MIESIELNDVGTLTTLLSSKEEEEKGDNSNDTTNTVTVTVQPFSKDDMTTLVITASQNGSFECLKALIDHVNTTNRMEYDINSKDRLGNNAIVVATNTATVEYLLQHGADANSSNKRGFSALMNAAKIGNQNCLSLLIRSGANVNVTEQYNNRTALMFASINGFENCVRILLENGAEVNRVDFERKSAVMYASQLGHEYCVDVLKEFHADMNMTDYRGRNAQSYSTFKGILQELVSGGSMGDGMMK